VIALAKKYFSVAENSNLHIIIAEVAEYIDTLHENYDLIIVDVYEDIIVPACCETIQFLQNLNENLAPNGMLVFNKFVFDGDSLASAFQLEKKFINIFTNTFTIKLRGIYSNWMLVATKD
jgi:spermidine synthase